MSSTQDMALTSIHFENREDFGYVMEDANDSVRPSGGVDVP